MSTPKQRVISRLVGGYLCVLLGFVIPVVMPIVGFCLATSALNIEKREGLKRKNIIRLCYLARFGALVVGGLGVIAFLGPMI